MMSREEPAPELVSQYLRMCKALCLSVGKKYRLSTEYCQLHQDPAEDPKYKEQMQQLVAVQLEIDEQIKKMLAFEKEQHIGVSLLNPEIAEQPCLYTTIIIMLAQKLNPLLKRHARTLSEIAFIAAGPNEDTHKIRMAFRRNGVLRPHVRIG